MPNRQYTSLLCLGAVLAHSSGAGVRHAFVVEKFCQIRRMHLKVITNILKATRLATGSQCSSFNTGVMWLCLLVRVTSLWLHCSEHAATELSVITGCYVTMSCSSRVESSREVTSALTALFAASFVR